MSGVQVNVRAVSDVQFPEKRIRPVGASPLSTPSDSLNDLARGAQNGRERDLDDLLAQLRPMVCRWAVVWTGSPDTAEDVAQTVLLRVNGSIGSYTPEGRFTTWAYRITKNVLIDYGRSNGRDHALHDGLRLEEVARAVAVDDGARSFEAVDLLRHLMGALSPQQRAALDLVDLQGFSAQEAAENSRRESGNP